MAALDAPISPVRGFTIFSKLTFFVKGAYITYKNWLVDFILLPNLSYNWFSLASDIRLNFGKHIILRGQLDSGLAKIMVIDLFYK